MNRILRATAFVAASISIVSANDSRADLFGCLCSVEIDPEIEDLITRSSAVAHVNSWLNSLKIETNSDYSFFVGTPQDGTFIGKNAVRFTVIIPSEYTRDTKSEWDFFEVVLTYTDPDKDAAEIWLTTKNYKRRNRGGFLSGTPSPDWEYKSVANEIANQRLKVLAHRIKFAAEGSEQRVLVK